jgi:hypothetical protein
MEYQEAIALADRKQQALAYWRELFQIHFAQHNKQACLQQVPGLSLSSKANKRELTDEPPTKDRTSN